MLAVVMPAFNEEDGIAEFVKEIDHVFSKLDVSLAICVQDDCSSDQTREVLQELTLNSKTKLVIGSNELNRGHGPTSVSAMKLGLETGAPFVLHVDGDGQYKAAELLELYHAAVERDVSVIGRRRSRTDPWFRRSLTWFLRRYIALLSFNFRNLDPNSPVRVHRRSDLVQLMKVIDGDSRIPSIWSSILLTKSRVCIFMDITTYDRRGQSKTGTMWTTGQKKPPLLPSKRLIKFVGHSWAESLSIPSRIRTFTRIKAN